MQCTSSKKFPWGVNKWINCTLYVTDLWVDQGMESINGRHWLSVMLTSYRFTGGWSRWSATNFKIIGSAFWHFIRDRHVKKRDNKFRLLGHCLMKLIGEATSLLYSFIVIWHTLFAWWIQLEFPADLILKKIPFLEIFPFLPNDSMSFNFASQQW